MKMAREEKQTTNIKTKYFSQCVDEKTTMNLYNVFRRTAHTWTPETRKGELACLSQYFSSEEMMNNLTCMLPMLDDVVKRILTRNFIVMGCGLSYFKDGKMFTPGRTHHHIAHLIICLGAPRKFMIKKKEYLFRNGDVIVFGSSSYKIPVDETCGDETILITVFLKPCAT